MTLKRTIFAATVAVVGLIGLTGLGLALAGCVKYSVDCRLAIRPRILTTQSSPADGQAAYMVRIYATYVPEAGKERWAPESYADADAGIIRNMDSGAARSHGLMAEQAEGSETVDMTLSNSPVILVAVDPINRLYAYRYFEYKPPLRQEVLMTLRFLLWKPEARYVDSYWTVVNENMEEAESPEESTEP